MVAIVNVRSDEAAKFETNHVEEVFQFRTVVSALVAGALSGAFSKTTTAPLDRTKLHFQVSSTERYSLRAAVAFIAKTYRTHGFFALYRGNSAMMARVMPFLAIKFAAYEQFKLILHVDENGESTPVRRFLSGNLAVMTATCLTYPLDTVRAQFATNDSFRSVRSVFAAEYAKSGILGFYRGVLPTLYALAPNAGMGLFAVSSLKIYYKERTGNPSGPLTNFLFGAIAGAAGQATSYPFDVVRRRMQTGNLPAKIGVPQALVMIARAEGVVGGLYKGLSMNFVKSPIGMGVFFASYDLIYESVRMAFSDRGHQLTASSM